MGDPHLPGAQRWSKIILSPDEWVRINLTDAKDFFYIMEIPQDKWARNCFWGKVPASWLGEGSERLVVPAVKCIPMGDTNAVWVAQTVHRRILDRFNALPPEIRLSNRSDVPKSKLWGDVYIDDYALAQIIERGFEIETTQDHELLKKARLAYQAAGVHLKDSKAVVDAEEVQI